jgi:hypothetical protein
MRCLARLVAGVIAAGGLALVQPAIAQQSDEEAALNTQINKLYSEGKCGVADMERKRAETVRWLGSTILQVADFVF